jgi:hypothetical protein
VNETVTFSVDTGDFQTFTRQTDVNGIARYNWTPPPGAAAQHTVRAEVNGNYRPDFDTVDLYIAPGSIKVQLDTEVMCVHGQTQAQVTLQQIGNYAGQNVTVRVLRAGQEVDTHNLVTDANGEANVTLGAYATAEDYTIEAEHTDRGAHSVDLLVFELQFFTVRDVDYPTNSHTNAGNQNDEFVKGLSTKGSDVVRYEYTASSQDPRIGEQVLWQTLDGAAVLDSGDFAGLAKVTTELSTTPGSRIFDGQITCDHNRDGTFDEQPAWADTNIYAATADSLVVFETDGAGGILPAPLNTLTVDTLSSDKLLICPANDAAFAVNITPQIPAVYERIRFDITWGAQPGNPTSGAFVQNDPIEIDTQPHQAWYRLEAGFDHNNDGQLAH